ncbi:MAG: hypothetical protein K2N10_08585, partial [Muribaculaceae bacterium]|nr:hypothetical protein [Muribaculaceae bacterium]
MKYKYLIATAAMTMMACSSNKADNTDQTAESLPDSATIEQPAPQTPDDILLPELSAEIYSRILNYTDETPVFISEHCTPELLKQLS